MLFSEIESILGTEEIILERLGDSYIHNVNKETLFKILKSGKIIGSCQNDGATPKLNKVKDSRGFRTSKPELCLSRSDYMPQKTGIVPTSKLYRGEIVKIQLKMSNITNGKLGIKKPYPVSFGNFKRNRELSKQLELLNDKLKNPTSKILLNNLALELKSKENFQNTKEKKGHWVNKEEFNKIISMVDKLENNKEVSNTIKHRIYWIDDTGEDRGEERIEMQNKSIPVSSKYMTINIPDEMYNDGDIRMFREKYKNDPELFKPYKDTSKEALRRR